MKRISVHYFAVLREEAGRTGEDLATAASTARDLFEELRARHGFSLARERLKVAINDEFAGCDAGLRDGDRIVFIPPVAGG